MSLINDSLKNITLKELSIVIILLYLIYYVLNSFNIIHFDTIWVYFFIIVYFLFKFRHCFQDFKKDFAMVFSIDILKYVLLIVCLNIFFSYGMLYLSNFVLDIFPAINSLLHFELSSLYLNNSLMVFAGFMGPVLISPISEELIFRGVLLNRLNILLPTILAVLLSSLLFAALHGFGSIISAFVFAICMAILYLKTENIFVPMFAHFLNNLFAEGIVIIDSPNMLFTNGIVMVIVSVLAIVSAIFIINSIRTELNNLK